MREGTLGPWWATLLVCVYYLLFVIGVTYRGMVALVRRRALIADLAHIKRRREQLNIWIEQSGDDAQKRRSKLMETALSALEAEMNVRPGDLYEKGEDENREAESGVAKSAGIRGMLRRFGSTALFKLWSQRGTLDDIKRELVYLVPPDELATHSEPLFEQLARRDEKVAQGYRDRFAKAGSDSHKCVVLVQAQEECDRRKGESLALEYESEQAAIWLAIVGLLAITGIAVGFGHQVTMLVGAVGGFLAPTVTSLTSEGVRSAWGVLILGPVGGALTAVGGVLLVNFLAEIGVLGKIFADSWIDPWSVVSLSVALLVGFSGHLFSQLAISAVAEFGHSAGQESAVSKSV
ncbi:hypothetical protein [Aldersonia kunmingensis]|uniref:hypothetical protein n=1 Tax=Aldersonia kunmingensis TaxID=408066 RepID=UPI000A5446D8|nr:hypothetical protein [Aldersonia kunmingensis]